MDYPEFKVWRRVLMSPKMLIFIIFYMIWDYCILGGALPYGASYICGIMTTYFKFISEPYIEIFALVTLVFLMTFVTLRVGIESWFWRRLFLMEKNYYCVLAVRDFLNCYTLAMNVMGLVNAMFASQRTGLRQYNLGEGTFYIFLVRLVDYGVPIDGSHIDSAAPHGGCFDGTTTCLHNAMAIESAELFVSVALLSSSLAKLLYINSLYSYMSAVELLSEFDPFLQIFLNLSLVQLHFDERNGNEIQRGYISSFSRPENNSARTTSANSNATPSNPPPNSSSPPNPDNHADSPPSAAAAAWGWPLSHFREDIAEDFPG